MTRIPYPTPAVLRLAIGSHSSVRLNFSPCTYLTSRKKPDSAEDDYRLSGGTDQRLQSYFPPSNPVYWRRCTRYDWQGMISGPIECSLRAKLRAGCAGDWGQLGHRKRDLSSVVGPKCSCLYGEPLLKLLHGLCEVTDETGISVKGESSGCYGGVADAIPRRGLAIP